MGLFAALMTYLVAAALLVGSAVAGLTVLLAPSETLTARSAPPLIRAADRKQPQQPAKANAKSETAPQVRIVTPPAAAPPAAAAPAAAPPVAATPAVAPSGPVANRWPAVPGQPKTAGAQAKATAPAPLQAAAAPQASAPPRAAALQQPVKKKKIVKKSVPTREAETGTGTLGYNPEPRRFVFPFAPGW